VAGFSFGSFVAWRVAAQRSVRELILISPPVARFDFGATQAHPTVVIQGDVDDVVLASDVERWVAGLSPAPPLATVTGAGHFFHGHLAELRQAVQAAVR
jgi:alpha/beta superfamily hydrolase